MNHFRIGELDIVRDDTGMTVTSQPKRSLISTLLGRARPEPQILRITPSTLTVQDQTPIAIADIQTLRSLKVGKGFFDLEVRLHAQTPIPIMKHLHPEELEWIRAEIQCNAARIRAARSLLTQMR